MPVTPICESDAGGPPFPSHAASWLPTPEMGQEASDIMARNPLIKSLYPDEAYFFFVSIQSFDMSSSIILRTEETTQSLSDLGKRHIVET
jgi:hypothetical protein